MLEDIINSKTSSKVLAFYLAAPARSFSIFEISRRLRIPYLKTSHVLNGLVEKRVLKRFTKKGKKYYILNSRYLLLPELRKNFKKVSKYTDELIEAVKKLGNIRAAFLSGIFTGYGNLPVDILLVGKVNLQKLDAFLKSAEKLMGQEINYSIMSSKEFVQRRNTFDRFIKDIFDYNHLVIIDKLKKG